MSDGVLAAEYAKRELDDIRRRLASQLLRTIERIDPANAHDILDAAEAASAIADEQCLEAVVNLLRRHLDFLDKYSHMRSELHAMKASSVAWSKVLGHLNG